MLRNWSSITINGGQPSADIANSVEILDGSTWVPGPFYKVLRTSSKAVVYRGAIYVIGGFTPKAILTSVEVYSGPDSGWSPAPALNQARQRHAAAVFNDRIYVMGGDTNRQDGPEARWRCWTGSPGDLDLSWLGRGQRWSNRQFSGAQQQLE
eukprot:TRINITY_DN7636_c0_g1_i1.p3 TRINITY_DN7636_c0_g1~~TRINITY_DN7636_c0_g1_i1.p3  ORF type:complete len:152 (+),score=15.30 TRINITY_DN7636_c0_g1_i1:3174-3629(+)